MTLDDLLAAPLVGANRHALELDEHPDKWAAYDMFGEMRGSTQEEADAFIKALSETDFPFYASVDEIMSVAERLEDGA